MMLARIVARQRRYFGVAVLALAAASCGGSGEQGEAAAPAEGGSAPPAATTTQPGASVARADFVLCPAVEGIADELASMAGFTRDRDRAVREITGDCFVRGASGSFVSVLLAPAIMSSVAMVASGYEAESQPAPELGADAVLVADPMQPHVIFKLLGQVVDVGAEGSQSPPDAKTMIAIAQRVRDALNKANGG